MESWRQELYSSELYHHGILGQKWGVRRFQNKDGTRIKQTSRVADKTKVALKSIKQFVNDVVQGFKEGYIQGLNDSIQYREGAYAVNNNHYQNMLEQTTIQQMMQQTSYQMQERAINANVPQAMQVNMNVYGMGMW